MASSSEAFAKFSTWKDSDTPLRVTMIERGESEVVIFGRIDVICEESSEVGIISPERRFGVFEVDDADFSIEPGRIVASRNDAEWLIFETEVDD